MSGLFGSITVKGNRLTEFAQQTATVGTPIPFGYGRFACEGNVIFAPMPPKEHVTKKKQGKGGGVTTVTYTYTLSYAVAFCEGPIYGYLTIKRNGKVVWTQDPNATVEDLAYAAKWAQKATFYFGTDTQLPDSTIEAYKGAGNVSAFRGLAYIVVEDDDVTDGGGAVPTYEAVIMATPPEAYLTSKPYPLQIEDRALYGLTPTDGLLRTIMKQAALPTEKASYGLVPTSGQLRQTLLSASVQPAKSSYELTPSDGLLRTAVKSTGVQPSKASYSLSPTGGELDVRLLTTDCQPSKASYSLTPSGGTLS